MSLYDDFDEANLAWIARRRREEEELAAQSVATLAPPAVPELPEIEGEGYTSPEEAAGIKPLELPEVEGTGYASPEEAAGVKPPESLKPSPELPEVEGKGYTTPEEAAGVKPEEPEPTIIKEALSLVEKPQEVERPEFIPGYRPKPGEVDKAREFLKETKQEGVQSDVQDTVNSILVGGSDKGLLAAMGGIYRLVEAKTRDMPWLSTVHENAKNQNTEVQKMRETVRAGLPIDKEFEQSLTGQFTSGAGQMLGTLPLAAAPGPIGKAVSIVTSIGQLYDEGYQDYIDTRKRLGKPIDKREADEAATKYTLGAAPIDVLAERFMLGKALRSQVGRKLGDVVKDITKTAASGGLSESGQQLWLNTVAKFKSLFTSGYDPDRALTEDLAESALVGGGLGGGVTTAGAVISSALPETTAIPSAAPAVPPPIPPTPPEAFAPPQSGVTITPAPGEVPAPPGLTATLPVTPAPPLVEGVVPPPIPGAVPPPLPPTGDERFAPPGAMPPPVAPPPIPASIEAGPPTPVGAAITQHVGAGNLAVKEVADRQAKTLEASGAPQTAKAIQQVARESNAGASVTAAEYLAQAKAQRAEAEAEAIAKAAPEALAATPVSPPIPTAAVPSPIPVAPAPPPIPTAVPTPAVASAAPTESAHAVVVGGQVFTGATAADAYAAAQTAVGPDAIGSAQTGWVDPDTGRFVSHEIYDAHRALNTAIEQAQGNMEHPAIAEAGAQLAEAQVRDEELNSQIVSPGGEQVIQSGIKGQEAVISVRPSQELAVPLAGVTVSVEGVDAQGQPVTVQRPAAQVLNDARNEKTALTILLDCLK